MTDEILMAVTQMTPSDLLHHGVKGQKWGVRRTPAELAAASGGPGGGASVENVDELEEAISENEQKLAEMKADGANEKEIRAMEASIKAGKERVNQILDAERRNGAAFEHAMSFTPDEIFTGLAEDELFFEHHGIKGQKWGIRRFQPYRQGMKVVGGKVVGAAKKVKQRFKDIGDARQKKKAAKLKAKAVKKAQATRKANANYEAEKKKAIESGSIEDLAKFKGKLTNEEYNRAFLRLQNEQKVAALVAANQKTVWDKVDKGMEIVARVSKYANTITVAKNNFDALNDALHKSEKEAAKERATLEKNKFLTNIDDITELNRGMDKHKLTPQEYQAAMNILANKKMNKIRFGTKEGDDFKEDQDFVDQDKKAAKEKAAKDQADRDRWNAEQNFKDFQRKQAKEAKRQEKAAQKQAKKEANAPKDGEWWSDSDSQSSGKTGKTGYRGMKWETREKQETGEQRTSQLLLTMKDNPPSASSVDTGKRVIKGFKSSQAGTTYRQTSLNFGDSEVKKFLAKTYEPSKAVTDTRKTVADTQAEAARQREEADKKRKKAFGHSAIGSSDELYHHGIKGQKWGVRRFQDKKGRLTAAGKERVAKYKLLNSKDTITEGHSYKDRSTFSYKVDLDTYEAEERVMPDGRIIYPAIATVIKDFADVGKGNPYPGPKGFDGLYDRVNPGYGEPGTTNNCPFVGATMEIASRGYNVVARRSLGGTSVGAFSHWFRGADTQKCDTWDEMSSDLKNMDDGASGVMQGYYGSGLGSGCGGHTLHWRKENGKVIVADGQSHKEMDFDTVQDSYGFGSKGCFFTRLDNCEPNWDALAADGVLGVNNSERKIVSKGSADTVQPYRAWSSTEFYGYSDVQAYRR